MAELTVHEVGITGANVAYTELSAASFGESPPAFPDDPGLLLDGDTFRHSKGVYAHIVNNSSVPVEVVFAGVLPCDQEHVHHTNFRIEANDDVMVSGFPSHLVDAGFIQVGLVPIEGGGAGGGGGSAGDKVPVITSVYPPGSDGTSPVIISGTGFDGFDADAHRITFGSYGNGPDDDMTEENNKLTVQSWSDEEIALVIDSTIGGYYYTVIEVQYVSGGPWAESLHWSYHLTPSGAS